MEGIAGYAAVAAATTAVIGVTTHMTQDLDGDGRTGAQETAEAVNNVYDEVKQDLAVKLEVAKAFLPLVAPVTQFFVSTESESGPNNTADDGKHRPDFKPLEGFQEAPSQSSTLAGSPIKERHWSENLLGGSNNGPREAWSTYGDQSVEQGPITMLREGERGADGRFVASTEIREDRLNRAYPWAETKRQIQQQAIDKGLYNPETENFIDPNTLEEINGGFHYGHTEGHESWVTRDAATAAGLSQSEYNAEQQDLKYWQIEDPESNMSHKHEAK